jgi:hypothetical protein
MKEIKQLKDDDLEKVTGGTGLDFEEENKPLEVDLPWWWKQPTENNKPAVSDDPFESNPFSSDEGMPAW